MANRWAKPSRSRTLGVMGVTAVAILAASYLADRPSAGGGGLTSVVLSGGAAGPAPEIGKTAPDFSATTLEGQKVKLSALRGHPVWLTFGASWCQPCRAENPDIEAAWQKYQASGLKLVAVFIQDDGSTIREYAKRTGLTYPKIDDSSSAIANSYRIMGIPSHFFIDRHGVLRQTNIGTINPEAIASDLAQIGVKVGGSTR